MGKITFIFKLCFALCICVAACETVAAESIAWTDFDNRTVVGASSHIATNIAWTTRGVDDPGTMSSLVNGTTDRSLFNTASKITEDMFAPSWNYGNSDGYWTTTVDLKVATGFVVTLTDVTFDYWAVSGSETHNVDRQADFIVTVFSPSAVALAAVTNTDIVGGTGSGVPVITSRFPSPIMMTNAGIYTIEIKAGELAGTDATGNHLGIDNLSINGIVEQPNVIAWTDFNVRTVTGSSSHIATNLNWITSRGVEDPGDMAALVNGTTDRAIFDTAGKITEDMFAPSWNYGNNGGYWSTTVDIKVAAGFIVTLTNVTFDYWALDGSEELNVNRQADFEVTVFDPSAVHIAAATNTDVLGGTGAGVPTVTATFQSPVLLTNVGTYTVEIKGGELAGVNETGNHIGIDTLSINGTMEQPNVIAWTDFNCREVVGGSSHIASNLHWTTRGVNDPGSMSSVVNDVTDQALFDTDSAITQYKFAPGWNYGNNGGYWTTTIDLKAEEEFVVTLTDVTFEYWALNGSEELNVNRRADFEVTLFDPSSLPLATVTNLDIFGGTVAGVPTVTSEFPAPIELKGSGTYTLEIKAGELGGVNETGAHLGIDNLSINGTLVIRDVGTLFLFQ